MTTSDAFIWARGLANNIVKDRITTVPVATDSSLRRKVLQYSVRSVTFC
jgi:hypothetical protein